MIPRIAAFEVTGGMGIKASKLVKELFSEAQYQRKELPSDLVTWSAQTYSAHYQQRLSFEISKYTAMAVLIGSRATTGSSLDSE